jgi:lysine/ornithine N-monooxygenase
MMVARTFQEKDHHFDVCIVGAGPAGLAVLSAIHAPYSLDGGVYTDAQRERAIRSVYKKEQLTVCVIDDSHNEWLGSWKKNFDLLGIEFLRSPALAHPDMFDPNSLLTYAIRHGREDELLESGCSDSKSLASLGQTQVGLWKLPSSKLFVDFCDDLARSSFLPHAFIGKSTVIDLVQRGRNIKQSNSSSMKNKHSSIFELTLQSKDTSNSGSMAPFKLTAGCVVLAIGPTGSAIIPPTIENAPKWRMWNHPPSPGHDESNGSLPVLVIGGGLTAIQVALIEVRRKKHKQGSVILCSKRPLVSQHFDISVDWFNHRTTNKCMSDFFYDRPINERVAALKEARNGGGSVPPLYLEQVRHAEQRGSLKCVVGKFQYNGADKSHNVQAGFTVSVKCDEADENNGNVLTFRVEEVIVACGMKPTCGTSECPSTSLISKIQSCWPVRCEGGLPCVTQDLRWKEGLDLFVVGALAALNGGPDAGNIMGMRRAAQFVANSLDCHNWLRETALVNPFEAFMDDDDSSDSDDDKETKAGEDSPILIDKKCSGNSSSTDSESSSIRSCRSCGFP